MSDKLRKAYRFATVPEHLVHDKSISDRAFRLWCILDRYAGKDESSFPLRETLATDLDCSRASVDRAIAELVAGGWLHKERRFAGGSNLYTLLIAPAASKGKKAQVRSVPALTSEDRGVSSPLSTGGVITPEDTPDAPVSRGVVTGDAHKEASPSEHQVTETSDDSLRSSSAEATQPALDGMLDGASSTPTIADEKTEHPGVPVARWWWEQLDPKPITTSKNESPFVHIRRICCGAIDKGWTQRQVADALQSINKPKPSGGELDQRLRALRDGTLTPMYRSRSNVSSVHRAAANDPDAARRQERFGGS